MTEEVEIQRNYYSDTAGRYDELHLSGGSEHNFALHWMIAVAKLHGVRSILDVGSGTGRALLTVKSEISNVRIVGIEPSPDLRRVGHSKGLEDWELIDGDAMKLAFPDSSMDLVCEFGALHHIPNPSQAVSEMLRVSRKAIFISDANNFGQGGRSSYRRGDGYWRRGSGLGPFKEDNMKKNQAKSSVLMTRALLFCDRMLARFQRQGAVFVYSLAQPIAGSNGLRCLIPFVNCGKVPLLRCTIAWRS